MAGGVVELQEKIAARIGHGGSLADVKREIIDPCPLGNDQRAALWLYAATRPEVIRAAQPARLGLRRPR